MTLSQANWAPDSWVPGPNCPGLNCTVANFLGPNLPRTSSIASESSDVNDDFDEPPAGKSGSEE